MCKTQPQIQTLPQKGQKEPTIQPSGSEIDPLTQEIMTAFNLTKEEAELHLRCLV